MADASFDFEDVGRRVDGLLNLAEWVQRARRLADDLEISAKLDPVLHAQLKKHEIAYGDAWWEDGEHSGFVDLLRSAAGDVRAMAAAGEELQRQARGKS